MELDQLGAIGDLIDLVSQIKRKAERDKGKELFDGGQTRTNRKLVTKPLGYVPITS